MKCNRCSKMATHHITELVKSEPHEVHLCEECFANFMQQPGGSELTSGGGGGLIKTSSGLGESELEALEKLVCPTCKITYREFRSQGRLGCAHCYTAFRDELLPLLENIHGDTHHCGKFPKRAPDDSQKRYQLIKLRNDLRLAIAEESYEEAARLRDQIHGLEHGTSADAPSRDTAE
ncbi:MAG: UvrB/UvrC motif-containing protein [Planctomycetes bacterium]|nr:UvrB/UvrC motif-containing protein [Planctomycetota bacterium]